MRWTRVWTAATGVALACMLAGGVSGAETYRIGVLAKRGAAKAVKKWGPTAEYLSRQVTGASFELVPLDFDEVFPAAEQKKVDFLLVNSSMFVTAKIRYGAVPVATLVNSRQGQALTRFGGVIFTSVDNEDINTLQDLKGRTFMAVKASSLGGWLMAYKEFLDAGIDPLKDLAQVSFGGKHDNVVLAVLAGEADAGTVRTDTLERMEAEGAIFLDDIKVLHPVRHPGFPFLCSTALYPEWPLARLPHVPQEVGARVAEALKRMKPEDKAAKAAKVVGWTDPLDYGPVEELQKTLKVGAYAP